MRIKLPTGIKTNTIITYICFLVLVIVSWAPFMANNPMGSTMLRRILNYFVILIIGVALVIGEKGKRFSLFELTLIATFLIHRLFYIFYAYDYKGLGISYIIIGVFFCVISDEERSDVFQLFRMFMIIISVVGIICYFSYRFHLGLPYSVVNRGSGVSWINFKICYLMNENNRMTRLNGTFEEPGWFGTWAAFFLCADGLNFRKKGNIILLLAGILTFSLAFVLILIIYYVLRNVTDWKKWIFVLIFVLFYLTVLPYIKTGNYAIDRVIERMIITKDGLSGDNRYGSKFAKLYSDTIHSRKIFFGYGAGYAEIKGTGLGEGLASIKSYIVNFGIIGTIIIFCPLFCASVYKALKNRNIQMLLFVFISFISLYQRPYIFNPPNFIVFTCGLSYLELNNKLEKYEII